jgi:hypothetical protein
MVRLRTSICWIPIEYIRDLGYGCGQPLMGDPLAGLCADINAPEWEIPHFWWLHIPYTLRYSTMASWKMFHLLVQFRREFSGMIHFITSHVIIPAIPSTPSIPY